MSLMMPLLTFLKSMIIIEVCVEKFVVVVVVVVVVVACVFVTVDRIEIGTEL